MTRIEFFERSAIAALQGLLANPDSSGIKPADIAKESVEHAESLTDEVWKLR